MSPDLVFFTFSASFFICLALLLYAIILGRYFLIFFHLPDTILLQFFRFIISWHLNKMLSHKKVVSSPRSFYTCLYACLCPWLWTCLFTLFVQADNLHFVHTIFLISQQVLFILLFVCFRKVTLLFYFLAIVLHLCIPSIWQYLPRKQYHILTLSYFSCLSL